MKELTQSRNPEAGDNAEAKEGFSLAFSGLAPATMGCALLHQSPVKKMPLQACL